MALQVAIANQLDALFSTAFSRSGETGAVMGPLHDLIVEKAATGTAAAQPVWDALIADLENVIMAKGSDLTEGIEPTNKVKYLSVFRVFCQNLSTGSNTGNIPQNKMRDIINDRGGPDASHRNAYLHYLKTNINAINNSAP